MALCVLVLQVHLAYIHDFDKLNEVCLCYLHTTHAFHMPVQ